jgi:hypothetical protein
MRIVGVLASVSMLLAAVPCGAQESPGPQPRSPESTPVSPWLPVASPQTAVCPVCGLPNAAPAYMDPRTHSWRQQQVPPPEQLTTCEARQCPGGCLGDRRHRCWFEVLWDGCRNLRQCVTEALTFPHRPLQAEHSSAPSATLGFE